MFINTFFRLCMNKVNDKSNGTQTEAAEGKQKDTQSLFLDILYLYYLSMQATMIRLQIRPLNSFIKKQQHYPSFSYSRCQASKETSLT